MDRSLCANFTEALQSFKHWQFSNKQILSKSGEEWITQPSWEDYYKEYGNPNNINDEFWVKEQYQRVYGKIPTRKQLQRLIKKGLVQLTDIGYELTEKKLVMENYNSWHDQGDDQVSKYRKNEQKKQKKAREKQYQDMQDEYEEEKKDEPKRGRHRGKRRTTGYNRKRSWLDEEE